MEDKQETNAKEKIKALGLKEVWLAATRSYDLQDKIGAGSFG